MGWWRGDSYLAIPCESVALNIKATSQVHVARLTAGPAKGSSGIRRIAVFAVVAILVVAGLGAAIIELYPGGGTVTTYQEGASTEQNDFTLNGPAPLVVVSPQNNTFTLTYSATTLSSPVISLSFNLSQSFVSTIPTGRSGFRIRGLAVPARNRRP